MLNLASLATFKYTNFLLASFESMSGLTLPHADIILPIGISFFSFQFISYLVDRMRGDAPVYPYRPFALFVLLYPHLIAGPIVRHNELVPQFADDPRREGVWQRIGIGLVIFTVGMAKKLLIADKLGAVADPLFAQATTRALDFGEAWTAVLAFTFQLFLDFSAYTEMAIGTAMIFGVVLPENFRRPYLGDRPPRLLAALAHLAVEFPARLSLHPARRQPPRAGRYVLATMGTMGLCGLWHGAGWTYVAWGLWHGAGLIVCRGWQQLRRPLPVPAGWAITMLFVIVGWVIFRAANFGTAGAILTSLAGVQGFGGALAGVEAADRGGARLRAHSIGARDQGRAVASAPRACRRRCAACRLLPA